MYTKEQIQKAMACKSVDELKSVAATESIDLTDEQANALFSQVSAQGELADDALDGASGGNDCSIRCPDCGSDCVAYGMNGKGYYCEDCGKSWY